MIYYYLYLLVSLFGFKPLKLKAAASMYLDTKIEEKKSYIKYLNSKGHRGSFLESTKTVALVEIERDELRRLITKHNDILRS